MSMKLSDYPPDWRAISQRIRFERAQGRCEAFTEDGGRCEAQHGQTIHRLGRYKENTILCAAGVDKPDWRVCLPCRPVCHGTTNAWGWEPRIRVVLTTAHTCDCQPLCGDPDHLLALRQLHHLRLDADLHARHAAATRAAKRAQRELMTA